MESYWCEKKNSIVDWINNGVDFDPALAYGGTCKAKLHCEYYK